MCCVSICYLPMSLCLSFYYLSAYPCLSLHLSSVYLCLSAHQLSYLSPVCLLIIILSFQPPFFSPLSILLHYKAVEPTWLYNYLLFIRLLIVMVVYFYLRTQAPNISHRIMAHVEWEV